MRAIQGALIVSSSIQIILGYSQLWGIFSRFFSPLGMAPVVALLGFGLFERGFPVVRAVHLTPHIFDTQAEHTMQYIFFQTGKIVHCIALLFDFTVRLGDALRLDFQC
jgi:xanthine/uracil permease